MFGTYYKLWFGMGTAQKWCYTMKHCRPNTTPASNKNQVLLLTALLYMLYHTSVPAAAAATIRRSYLLPLACKKAGRLHTLQHDSVIFRVVELFAAYICFGDVLSCKLSVVVYLQLLCISVIALYICVRCVWPCPHYEPVISAYNIDGYTY